ncbi:hypothetical protein J6590_062309 [Homalodisca vitripennis]|nr:hypothetical protein J6590_062309 [Homalodisca vitripennis]
MEIDGAMTSSPSEFPTRYESLIDHLISEVSSMAEIFYAEYPVPKSKNILSPYLAPISCKFTTSLSDSVQQLASSSRSFCVELVRSH